MVTERKPISSSLTSQLENLHGRYLVGSLLAAVTADLMIALNAVDDVRAAALRRDGIGTAVTYVTVPPCWHGGRSLLGTNAQQTMRSLPCSTSSLREIVAMSCVTRNP